MAEHFVTDHLYIHGSIVPGNAAPLGVEDPATEEAFTTVPTADAAQVEEAITAAHAAFESGTWTAAPTVERIAALGRMAEALQSRREDLRR